MGRLQLRRNKKKIRDRESIQEKEINASALNKIISLTVAHIIFSIHNHNLAIHGIFLYGVLSLHRSSHHINFHCIQNLLFTRNPAITGTSPMF